MPRPIRCKRSSTRFEFLRRSPICGRAPTPSARSPGCGTAFAARSTTFSRSRAFSTSTRRSSPPATAKGPARCSRSPRSTWPTCRKQAGRVDYAQDFFDRPAFLTVSGQLRGRNLRLLAGQDLHVRPDVSRRELEHLAAPGRVLDGRAGNGLLRADRQHGPGRGVSQAHFLATCSTQCCRGHAVFQRANRQHRARHARSDRRQRVRACSYTEAIGLLEKSGQKFEFPVGLGPRPAGRARALSHRAALSAGR